jgi:hypothetical protein
MSENQAGWQQRIAAALTAKATHGVLQGPWNDQKREPAILLQDALDTVAEYGQNAVDALPPPKPVRQQCGLCGAFLPNWKDGERILKCGRCGTESVRDALPPAPEVKDSKLSAIDPDTGSDEGMTPLCAYDTKRLMALQPRQDTQALVELWHETRQSYRRGPVILAHIMDLGSKLADALEALSESSASSSEMRLAVVVAQLRNAYGQLIYEPHRDRTWDHRARKSFADGLIAPQIRALEELIAAAAHLKEGAN